MATTTSLLNNVSSTIKLKKLAIYSSLLFNNSLYFENKQRINSLFRLHFFNSKAVYFSKCNMWNSLHSTYLFSMIHIIPWLLLQYLTDYRLILRNHNYVHVRSISVSGISCVLTQYLYVYGGLVWITYI